MRTYTQEEKQAVIDRVIMYRNCLLYTSDAADD